jgi:hypothetical protein
MRSIRLLMAILLLGLASCADTGTALTQGSTPRGFPQAGSPFPYNGTGW